MSTASFTKLAVVTVSTRRNPTAASGGKIGAAATKIASLPVLPLMPLDPEIVELYQIKSPREAYVTYTQGSPDVLEGDVLVASAGEYRVKGVGPWLGDEAYLEIVLEKVKGS